MIDKKKFVAKIGEWYDEHRRELPWRNTTDPYRIWLSEIILQQTRVNQGLPYYLSFSKRFQDVNSLAHAREQEVLRLWQGLGYYTRARNLHRCAKVIVAEHGGQFPDTYEELLKLPGIGSYTAAAIASVAFQKPVAVVDGNVFRVLSRIFGDDHDIASGPGKRHFFELAQKLIPQNHPGEFNQAMMEFGALHCVPKNPKCDNCPFQPNCIAYARGWQDRLPVKSRRTEIKKRYLTYFVFRHGNKWAMRRREGKDIWKGLYDFYLVECARQHSLKQAWKSDAFLDSIELNPSIGGQGIVYTHDLSHQQLVARFVTIDIPSEELAKRIVRGKKIKFYSTAAVNRLPKPILVTRYLEQLTVS